MQFCELPFVGYKLSKGVLGYLTTDLTGDIYTDFGDYPIIDSNTTLGIIALKP